MKRPWRDPRQQPQTPPSLPPPASRGEGIAPRARSVAEIVARVRGLLAHEFREGVLVQGEASNVRRPRGGHLYLTLKDRRAQLRVVVFERDLIGVPAKIEDGMQVVVRGKLDAYPDSGDLQLVASWIEPVGLGEREARLAKTRDVLRAEGLFDTARKRPLPRLPRAIGLVTSPTGAAIRDVLSTIDRRFPRVRVVVSPVRVTGEVAAPEIALALRVLDRAAIADVIILARGGGSREELWAFNEEVVARAIAGCRVPVISGVGHETDVTVADLVADVRAPTPTAAAELVVPELKSLEGALSDAHARLVSALRGRVRDARRRVDAAARSYAFRATSDRIRERARRLEDIERRLKTTIATGLRARGERIAAVAGKLDSLSPLKVLARGYSLTTTEGRVVRDAAELEPGDRIETRLANGTVTSTVESVVADRTKEPVGEGEAA